MGSAEERTLPSPLTLTNPHPYQVGSKEERTLLLERLRALQRMRMRMRMRMRQGGAEGGAADSPADSPAGSPADSPASAP